MKKVNSDVAYDYIRKKILNGEYYPGYALMTEALSAEIKVSRTPIREALHKLKGEGLVSISPHLGASVKKMNLEEFREMCELRLALEEHATGLAAMNHTQADLREIKEALDEMRSLTERILDAKDESQYITELQRQDVRFHIAIMTAAKNDLMKREILRLHLVNRVVIGPMASSSAQASKADRDANRRKVLTSHEQIMGAITKRDARAAKEAMEYHIQDIIEKSIRQMSEAARGEARQLSEEELVYSG